MTAGQPAILIVEDDTDVADMLNAYFNVQGYDVSTVNQGEDTFHACRTNLPDLIILDIRLPDIDGYEVARRLRRNMRTKEIPIIFLTERRNRADRLLGLEIGADDYITKPFDIQELRLRVRNALRRSSHGALTNPVTHLPEGRLVDERLRELLGNENWSILTVKLEYLDDFRESYGFVASDDVVRAISLMIQNAVRDLGNPNDFLGQLSLSHFILVTTPRMMEPLADRIRTRLEQSLDYFYPVKDRERYDLSGKRLKITIMLFNQADRVFLELSDLQAAVNI